MLKIKNLSIPILTKQNILVVAYFAVILIAFYIINIGNLNNFSYTFLIYMLFLAFFPKTRWIKLPIFG
ncbi:hypothetical protein, partial [Gilliamella sp. Fer4-1]